MSAPQSAVPPSVDLDALIVDMRAAAATLERFGQIDSCFANAGVPGRPAPIDTMTTDEWRRVLSVNLDGQFYTVRAVAGHMKSRRTGSIVFTSSVSMTDGLPFAPHYAASKAGVAAMARGLAVELARDGIRVNAIVPGWTVAAMTEGLLDSDAAKAKILPRVPLRRWGAPADFGALAAEYPDLSMGSYPFQRNGVLGTNLVVRGTDGARIDAAMIRLAALFGTPS